MDKEFTIEPITANDRREGLVLDASFAQFRHDYASMENLTAAIARDKAKCKKMESETSDGN